MTGLKWTTWFALFVAAGACRGAQPMVTAHYQSGTNLALRCRYTWNHPPSAFPEGYNGHGMCRDTKDAVQLTDGELATRCWWDERTVGWWFESGFLNLTIDLGRVQPIDAVDFHLSSEETGLRVPVLTGIFVSDDNTLFYPAGEIDKPEALRQWRLSKIAGEQDLNPHAWIGITNLHAKGRYVVLSFQSANLYLDEIRVFPGSLKASDVDLPQEGWQPNLALRPFYKHNRAYVAANVLTPMELLRISQGSQSPGPDIYLDLPRGLTLAYPVDMTNSTAVTWRNQPHRRYSVVKATRLFIESAQPTGTVSLLRMTGMPACTNLAGMEQVVEVETLFIPEAPLFKTLLAAVPMDCAYCWTWPDVVGHYKRLGLNLFMPCGHTDYYYRFMIHDVAEARQLIASAKTAGLKVGGSFSPFCNIAIPKKRPAVFLSGRSSANGCPRGYLEKLDEPETRERGEVAQAAAGAAAGLDWFTFDSEPYWPGEVCACEICEQAWERFLARRAPDLPVLRQQAVVKDRNRNAVYLPLMQAYWNAFYVETWGMFRTAMEAASDGNPNLRILLYGNPGSREAALGRQMRFGNEGGFLPLFNEGIINGANPSWYSVPTDQLGDDRVRAVREGLPPTCPMYVWVTAGGASLAYERSSADFKHRLLELFFNGAQGFFVWSHIGMDARDYQAVAEVVRQVQPVERFVTHGRLLPLDAFDAPEGVRVRGIQLGMEAIILVSRYHREDAADVTITLKVPPATLPARRAEPLDGGGSMPFVDRQLHVHYSGAEEQWVQAFRIHP